MNIAVNNDFSEKKCFYCPRSVKIIRIDTSKKTIFPVDCFFSNLLKYVSLGAYYNPLERFSSVNLWYMRNSKKCDFRDFQAL